MDDQFPKDENSAKVDYVVPPEFGPGEEPVNFNARKQQDKFLGGVSEQPLEKPTLNNPEEVSDEQLTLKKAQALFFLSFRFSQGDADIQGRIFEYLHSLHPKWIISDEFREQLKIKVSPSIRDHILPPENVPYKDQIRLHRTMVGGERIDVPSQLREMQKIFSRENTNPPSMLDVAKNIIDRDFRFLCTKNGRSRSPVPKDTTYNPQMDPFLSHICYYGLEENSTKVEEYDRMFRDVRKVVLATLPRRNDKRKEENPINLGNLYAVVNKYAQTHPQSVSTLKSLGFPLGHTA